MPKDVFSESVPLADLLVRSAISYPDRVALAFPDREFTYGQLLESATRSARSLYSLGIHPGDHVGLLMPNSPEYVEGYFGVALLGAVIVPLNARLRSTELGYIIENAQLTAVLTTDSIAARTDFRAILGESLPSLAGSAPGRPLALPEAENLRHLIMLRGEASEGTIGQDDFASLADAVDPSIVDRLRGLISVRDVAMILYASGTTAHPKGCLITNEGITRGSVGRAKETVPFPEPLEDRAAWCPLPLFHIASMQVFLATIAMGAMFVTDVFVDGARALEAIKRYRVTSIWPWFVPTMNMLLGQPDFDASELDHVTSVILVGPTSDLRHIMELFPQALLINGSGMSEMAGCYTISPMDDTPELRATTAGKPVS
ncbi:AMP-binding protein [Cryobacterium aureum]|uniref:AMP-binding protein n=1 Tax=Cryobacterium aureum TaxID=995037 RepID=UPI000CF55EB9